MNLSYWLIFNDKTHFAMNIVLPSYCPHCKFSVPVCSLLQSQQSGYSFTCCISLEVVTCMLVEPPLLFQCTFVIGKASFQHKLRWCVSVQTVVWINTNSSVVSVLAAELGCFRKECGSACNWARARELWWILRLRGTIRVGAGISCWVGGSTWFAN